MHSNYRLFSPEPSTADEYVMVVLTLLNNFHKTLRERQSQCLNKVRWGQPVLPGKHASFTIDRKHRGIRNLFDTDPNATTSDDEAETEEGTLPTEEVVVCGNKDSDVVIQSELPDIEQGEEAAPVCEQPNIPVYTEEPLKTVPSVSGDFLHSNPDDYPKSITKRMKFCKKLGSNKENLKQNVKVHCLQRRSLFRKARKEISESPVLFSGDTTQDIKTKQMAVSLSNNLSNGTTTSLDMNLFQKSVQDISTVLPSKDETLEQKSERIQQESLSNVFPDGIKPLLDTSTAEFLDENPILRDPMTCIAICPVSKDFPSIDKSFSSPRTPDVEYEKGSPLRENQPLNSYELRSSSPIFSAYESPFRNLEFASHLKDNSGTKSEESAIGSVGCSVTNPEETSSDRHSEPYSKLSNSESEDFVEELPKKSKRLKKLVISKKLQKQQALVQCPLCCEWFKPKVIETHAANCGINTPLQQDEPVNLVDLTSIPNKNEVEKETCDLNRPSESEDSNPEPPKNTDIMREDENVETAAAVKNVKCPPNPICNNNSKEPTEQLSTSLVILDPAEERSVITSVDRTTTELEQKQTETVCLPSEIQAKESNSISAPVLKRCFICDLSYVDGKPFMTHLRSCRKNYQKLKRQFSGFTDENEEPQRKTRSRSST